MGYHIINYLNGSLKHEYAETYDELAYFDSINNNTIIFEGEEHWTPVKAVDSEKYKKFTISINADKLDMKNSLSIYLY